MDRFETFLIKEGLQMGGHILTHLVGVYHCYHHPECDCVVIQFNGWRWGLNITMES